MTITPGPADNCHYVKLKESVPMPHSRPAPVLEAGTCSGCSKPATRGPSGSFWHTEVRDAIRCPVFSGGARFVLNPEPQPADGGS